MTAVYTDKPAVATTGGVGTGTTGVGTGVGTGAGVAPAAGYGTTGGYGTTAPVARSAASPVSDIILFIFAILLPPVAVFLRVGCHVDFWINVCLTILGWLPGVLHAWYVIVTKRGIVL